ncbi:hypothetical protein [Lysobacter enzymogenes]|uniref:hypothetical protein n=1 Tax=Lysobacter enzymogenes TaxID=69 RepID=UPI001A96CB31|nr:hypothetical protein [Lysobacter enzymogenes]QQP98598.1 hypothetical protein JHW38_11715 [Lysobacter enzymogenes]
MDDPYTVARAAVPQPPPQRALFSGFVAAAICLLMLLVVAANVGGNSYRFSQAGFFAVPARTDEIAGLQALQDYVQYSLIAASALCLALSLPRLRAGKLRWARNVTIWLLAAGSYALGDFLWKSLSSLIVGMP